MAFVFKTKLTVGALAAGSRALRKTLNKKQKRREYINIGEYLILGTAYLFLCYSEMTTGHKILIVTTPTLLGLYLFYQDKINGCLLKLNQLQKIEEILVTFTEEKYTVRSATSQEDRAETYAYSQIQVLTESERYFVLILDSKHFIVLDKEHIREGGPNTFRKFIAQKTGQNVIHV